jgi:hypothetical protein
MQASRLGEGQYAMLFGDCLVASDRLSHSVLRHPIRGYRPRLGTYITRANQLDCRYTLNFRNPSSHVLIYSCCTRNRIEMEPQRQVTNGQDRLTQYSFQRVSC